MATKGKAIDAERNASPAAWWKTACIYQIYPASFFDSNADGVGDLPGVLKKLDYVKSIGVDALWLSSFYDSPGFDHGYDVADFQQPDTTYGTLQDVEDLIKGCHERGLKIIFDLSTNHTSHLHRWFKESRKSKDNSFRQHYIWRPPRQDANGERLPPTNWRRSAWTFDDETQEYYLHMFTPQQPDLNWQVEAVRNDLYKGAIAYWLDKGVDGFRVNNTNLYSKPAFKDVPITDESTYDQPVGHLFKLTPELEGYLREMSDKAFAAYPEAVTLAEVHGSAKSAGELELAEMLKWSASRRENENGIFSMAVRSDIADLDRKVAKGGYSLQHQKLDFAQFKKATAKAQELADPQHGGWLCNYLENHDQSRSITRYGSSSPEDRVTIAKMLATHLLTLSGTLLLYQGQELGMTNMPDEWGIEEYADKLTQSYWKIMLDKSKQENSKVNLDDAMKGIRILARDHARTPMQWNRDKHAGFSKSDKTWMRVNENYPDVNVDGDEMDPDSVLNFYRILLRTRAQYLDTLVFGTFELLDPDSVHTFCYVKQSRKSDKHTIFVALNFSGEEQEFNVPKSLGEDPEVLVSTLASNRPTQERVLAPWEGRIYVNLDKIA